MSQQMIQRWLVIFAREHLADICDHLMRAANEYMPVDAAQAPSAMPKSELPAKSMLPHLKDEPEAKEALADESAGFFILDSLRLVLLACVDNGSSVHASLRTTPDQLLPFCFARLHVGMPASVRQVASECVGILSRVQLKAVVDLFIESLGKLGNDRAERSFVPYQRAASAFELSTHSAEQAASTLRYL
jgi:hypothetical protein